MNKRQLSFFTCALCAALIALSGCGRLEGLDKHIPPQKKRILAIVYTDLTKSIDEQTANRQKQNIEELFQNLPPDANFFLFSIDTGTN
jgi:hypothetical protein